MMTEEVKKIQVAKTTKILLGLAEHGSTVVKGLAALGVSMPEGLQEALDVMRDLKEEAAELILMDAIKEAEEANEGRTTAEEILEGWASDLEDKAQTMRSDLPAHLRRRRY
jgi:hypothetical protein